ncbi:helix-turn-helix domain-containing protein [uncultured Amnibacterium sp.]|uniref:helix-turn-helix domain-containing protein n=1 Tax=uncultured Amnibacterium sp. TaxID=1631851 RepID=UPI0035C9BCF0
MPLARHFGIHRTSVYAALQNAGVPRRLHRIDDAVKAEAIRLYGRGDSVAKIATELDCSYHGIYQVLRRAGVEMRDRHWRASTG